MSADDGQLTENTPTGVYYMQHGTTAIARTSTDGPLRVRDVVLSENSIDTPYARDAQPPLITYAYDENDDSDTTPPRQVRDAKKPGAELYAFDGEAQALCGGTLVVDNDGQISGVDPKTGTTRWRIAMSDPGSWRCSDGDLIVPDGAGEGATSWNLRGFDSATGKETMNVAIPEKLTGYTAWSEPTRGMTVTNGTGTVYYVH